MMATQRRDVGRMVFGKDSRGKPEWLVLTLSSHVENVARLAELWDSGKAYLSTGSLDLNATRQQLIRAAQIHDMAKPAKFQIQYQRNPFRNNVWEWIYSFKGHRFEAFDDDPYIQTLARLHHEYSVGGITKSIAQLRAKGIPHAENLPLDLYTLEMCDQIEATAARSALGEEPEERVFMDFYIEDQGERNLVVDPFPFNTEKIILSTEYAVLTPDNELVTGIESTEKDSEQRQMINSLRDKIINDLKTATLHTMEVTLCPLVTL